MACPELFSKAELTADQLAAVRARLDAPEHAADWYGGLAIAQSWEHFRPHRVFAFMKDACPVGVAAIDGANDAIDPAWWIDSAFRGRGYGHRMIEVLAVRLVADGVTGIRTSIVIASGPHDPASRRLVDLLRERIASP